MCKPKLLWRFIMAKLKGVIYSPIKNNKQSTQRSIDIAHLTNDEIDSMDLCPEAKAAIKRMRNNRQSHRGRASLWKKRK